MLKKLIFALVLFTSSILTFGQVQNIANLSTGVFQRSAVLKDINRNVIGYAYIYNKGLVDEDKNQLVEYVILDKNLNKLTNGDFKIPYNNKLIFKFTEVSFNNQKLFVTVALFNKNNFANTGDILLQINLKTNQILSDVLAAKGTILKSYNLEEFTKSKVSRYSISTFPYFGGSELIYIEPKYLVTELYSELKSVQFYNNNFDDVFKIAFEEAEKGKGFSKEISTLNKDKILFLEKHNKVVKGVDYIGIDRLVTYNLLNGEVLSDVNYNHANKQKEEYFLPNTEFINDNLVVIGEIKYAFENSIYNIENKPTLGLQRNIYNSKGQLIQNETIYYNDIFKELDFKDGKNKKGYKFILKEFFNFNDNSFTVLLEQQRFGGSKDLILVNFDNNGKFKNYVVLENGKNPFGSYMFSQENKEDNEVLFFYRESTKDSGKKTYNLVINKLKDGELTQEKLPFKTESSDLNFVRAQYGYILVSEYDKDDKESTVRLEKINL